MVPLILQPSIHLNLHLFFFTWKFVNGFVFETFLGFKF
jgi:hypothetical protein